MNGTDTRSWLKTCDQIRAGIASGRLLAESELQKKTIMPDAN